MPLCAYVVWREGAAGSRADLVTHLKASLPAYMLPARFTVLKALPLSANGKVDRNALPPPPAAERSDDAPSPPGDDAIATLAGIWREILQVDGIGPEDNFFDLGGYSLLTVRMLTRIEETFGRRLSFAELFETPTLAALAERVTSTPAASGPQRLIRLQPDGDQPPLVWLDVGPQLRALATGLGPRQPVIGLNLSPEDEDALRERGVTVARLASVVVDHLQRLRPQGPLRLAGWCRWGLVALEAARNLRAAGREVEIVVVLDAPFPEHPLALRSLKRDLGLMIDGRRRPSLAQAPFGDLVEAAARRYVPSGLAGPVLVLQAADDLSAPRHAERWRSRIKGHVDVKAVRGDHRSLLQPPNVAGLAAALRAGLAAVEEAKQPNLTLAPVVAGGLARLHR